MKRPPIHVKTLSPQKIRDLTVKSPLFAAPHLSAASGLVIHDSYGYVVADDEHHLGIFNLRDPKQPLKIIELFPGSLPDEPKARKRLKPDLEALFAPSFPDRPGLLLLALPSGSRENRCRGSMLTLPSPKGLFTPGTPAAPVPIPYTLQDLDLSSLYEKLRRKVPDLNIEGALDLGNQIWLLHRGNQSTSPNCVVILKRNKFMKRLHRKPDDSGPLFLKSKLIDKTFELNLGRLDGLRLTVTDGTVTGRGHVLLSAAAEDTESAYDDGQIKGSALIMLDPHAHQATHVFVLRPRLKVEGIAFDPKTKSLWMVTDHDSRNAAAGLWQLPMTDLGL